MLDEISKALPDFVWLERPWTRPDPRSSFNGQSSGPHLGRRLHQRAFSAAGWFPTWTSSSSRGDINNIITYACQAAFKNPEVAAKAGWRRRAAAARRYRPPAGAAPAKR